MNTATSGNFLSFSKWFSSVINENVVLCGTSALELLGMFNGLIDEKNIDVYALERGRYDNINYRIVDTFDNLDVVTINGIRCTSFEQTVNDMLDDIDNTDEYALTEALANYYCLHGDSFDGLHIREENKRVFESVKDSAVEYYGE